MQEISSLKLVFFNYLRKQGYDPKKMIEEEIDLILKEAKGSFPENPDKGEIFYFHSDLYDTEFSFVYFNKWSLLLRGICERG